MAEISQQDQLALHEFSVRYRAGFAQANPTPETSIDTVKDAVREEYEREQQAKRSPSIEPSSPTPERQPEEPDQDR
jgi:hypothetical protein